MDINEVLHKANQNKKDAVCSKSSRYTTDIKPAKKLPRSNVNPKAIQAFLEKQKQEERTKLIEHHKKKEALQNLRLQSKSTKKANAMAKRTKDNLKVYKGEDVLGLHAEPKRRRQSDLPPLSPEAEKRHKAFMNNILPKVKLPGFTKNTENGCTEPGLKQDEKKIKKLKKMRAKARSASNLDFSDLLQLAEKHKNKVDSSSEDEESSASDSDNDSDESDDRPLTSEERYQKERRKRKKLEEKLKLSKLKHKKKAIKDHESSKHKKNSSSFKTGKLDQNLTEESKRAKVKALMAKLNKSAEERTKTNQISSQKGSSSSRERTKADSYSNSKAAKPKVSISNKHKHPRPEETPRSSKTLIDSGKKQDRRRQSDIRDHLPPSHYTKKPSSSKQDHTRTKKYQTTNPYKQTVVVQSTSNRDSFLNVKGSHPHATSRPKQSSVPPTKCTLSVTSEAVKTNYPGIARADPYVQSQRKNGNSKPKLTPEMVARYKAALMRKVQQHNNGRHSILPQKRRYGVIEDDDEYDSELEDFIVDGEEEHDEEFDVSSQIKAIFGYDRTKYGRESEWELSRMEASYKDIEKEEKKSLKIAKQEDAVEAKLEEERRQRCLKGK